MIGRTLYVQIWENRIKVTDVGDNRIYDEAPLVAIGDNQKGERIVLAIGNSASSATGEKVQVVNPFSHPRVLLSDFTVAEKLLQHVFRQMQIRRFLAPIISVVIHPMEKIEGGLTQVEMRAFRELALNAGAREVVIHEGIELPTYDINFESLRKAEFGEIPNPLRQPIGWQQLLFIMVVVLLVVGVKIYGN